MYLIFYYLLLLKVLCLKGNKNILINLNMYVCLKIFVFCGFYKDCSYFFLKFGI